MGCLNAHNMLDGTSKIHLFTSYVSQTPDNLLDIVAVYSAYKVSEVRFVSDLRLLLTWLAFAIIDLLCGN